MSLLREPLGGISRSAAARYSVAVRVRRMIHIIFVRLLESDVVLLVGQIVDTAHLDAEAQRFFEHRNSRIPAIFDGLSTPFPVSVCLAPGREHGIDRVVISSMRELQRSRVRLAKFGILQR